MHLALLLITVIGLGAAHDVFAQGDDSVQSTDVIEQLIEAAVEGATVVVPPGRYEGHLRVKKGVVLEGNDQVTIDGGGEGVVVMLLAPDITFRGFLVQGSGSGVDHEPSGILAEAGPVVIEDNMLRDVLFGIDLRTSPDSIVRRNTITGKDFETGRRGDGIRLWWSHNGIVEANEVTNSRDMVFWYSEGLMIRGNHVTDSRYGLHFMYSHDTVLEANTLENNSVGIYLMYSNRITLRENKLLRNRGASGYGIGLKDCDDIVVAGNHLLANRVGIYVDNSPSSVDAVGLVEDNFVAFNEIGLLATPITHDNVLTNNAFIENEEQVAVHGKGALVLNAFSRDGVGNFWSDYPGFDADHDGVGDLPYAPRDLFEGLLAREPNLRLFVHSPAQQAVAFAGRAMPELLPKPKFVDPAPLAKAPDLSGSASAPALDWPMTIACFALLATATALLWAGARLPDLSPIRSTGKAGAA